MCAGMGLYFAHANMLRHSFRVFLLQWTIIQCFLLQGVLGQNSSAPFSYPGMPTTPYGPDWRTYFEVNSTLTNVTFPLPHTYAGSVSVNRPDHPNNTLFFLAFEKEGQTGSLAADDGERVDEPWMIWLNGGPGSSSMIGAFTEHGPVLFQATPAESIGWNITYEQNQYSWHQQADIFYIDQPVGTGFSTADADAYVADEDEMGRDFAGFLTNLVAIFPSLKKRPLHLIGESYSGVYIPYIAKTLFGMASPPVNLIKIAIGDGLLTTVTLSENFPILGVLETYPQLIDFNTTIYEYFLEQYNLCGYNLTLQYPSPEPYPPINPPVMTALGLQYSDRRSQLQTLKVALDLSQARRNAFKRQTNTNNPSRRFSSTGQIDPHYQCSLFNELIEYAYEFTVPWQGDADFDVYDIPDAVTPAAPQFPDLLLNDPAVQLALHTPQKTWESSIRYPFASNPTTCNCSPNPYGDPSPESMQFLSELSQNVSMVIYEGNDDMLVAHREAELAIQNMTFGGIRGFTRRPSTPWTDTDSNYAGIIHQERNVTYALVVGAGHLVAAQKPKAAYALLEQFILGNYQTGAVVTDSGGTSVVGGEHTEYFGEIITATNGAYTGSGAIQGTYTWDSSYWENWGSFMAMRTPANMPAFPTGTTNNTNEAAAMTVKFRVHAMALMLAVVILFSI